MSDPLPLSDDELQYTMALADKASKVTWYVRDFPRLIATIDHWRKRAEAAEAERDEFKSSANEWRQIYQKAADQRESLLSQCGHWRKRAEAAEAEVVFQRDANANNVAQWSDRCQKVEDLRHRLEGALRQIVAGHMFPGTVAREALEGQP